MRFAANRAGIRCVLHYALFRGRALSAKLAWWAQRLPYANGTSFSYLFEFKRLYWRGAVARWLQAGARVISTAGVPQCRVQFQTSVPRSRPLRRSGSRGRAKRSKPTVSRSRPCSTPQLPRQLRRRTHQTRQTRHRNPPANRRRPQRGRLKAPVLSLRPRQATRLRGPTQIPRVRPKMHSPHSRPDQTPALAPIPQRAPKAAIPKQTPARTPMLRPQQAVTLRLSPHQRSRRL